MNVLTPARKATPADLLAAPDANLLELVNGELVEKKVSVLSSLVETRISSLISEHVRPTNAGLGWGGTHGYRCFPGDPKKVRKPDVSFVRAERFKREYLKDGFLTIAPDLAVEVVSPNDLAHEIVEKVEEYLAARVPLVWVVYPEERVVDVYRQDGTCARLHADAEITGEDVLPDFRCPVASFFPQQT